MSRPTSIPAAPAARSSRRAAGIRRWLRPPRRLRFSRAGGMFSGGALLLGVAAIGTGNNLLFLLLGGMLGFITLSGWLSEQMIRRLEVRRRLPRGVTAGEAARVAYEVRNAQPRLPSFAVELTEVGLGGRAWVHEVQPGETAAARAEVSWPRRGVYALETLTLATSFPFGLFRKERDVELPAEVVVWPRHDRAVREPRPAGERVRRVGETSGGSAGARGEFRSLRPYRPGDDPRDVHWRTTARLGAPVVREYERDRAQALWLVLDLRAPEGEAAEDAAETAASLAAAATRRGDAFALATADARVGPGTGTAHLERVLDALARARFHLDAPPPESPAPPPECVLVTPAPSGSGRWGDVFAAAALPARARVLLHDDPTTTLVFVVRILRRHFGMSPEDAHRVAMEVHQRGIGLAGAFPRADAIDRIERVSAEAHSHGFPLLLTWEPE